MATTWTIAIDWDRNGDYSGDNDNVTDKVISANWFLGFRQPFKDVAHDSMLELVLNNTDRRFSPENATLLTSDPIPLANPLYGKVAPFRTVRVQSNDGTTTRTHWIGWIEKIEPAVNAFGERTAKITAAGPMVFFEKAETAIALQENQRTDDIISKLIEEVVIPPALSLGWFLELPGYSELDISTILPNATAFKALDAGQVTLEIAADNWVKRGDDTQDAFNVYRAIGDVVAAERGRFFFDREGRAIFWNRIRLQDEITSAVTLDNSMEELQYGYAGIEDFSNEVIVTCHPREVGASANEVLWQLTEKVNLKPGEKRTVNVKYQDTTTGNIRIGAKDVTVTDVVFSRGNGAVVIKAKANGATLEITNTGSVSAQLTSCKVRGRKITDYGRMDVKSQNGLSIAYYGRRSMKMNLQSVDNSEYAQSIADYEIIRRGEPRGLVNQVSLTSHSIKGGGYHSHQLARTLGDVITLSEEQTQHNDQRYTIIGEAQRLTKGLLETTWYLEPGAKSPFPWKLEVTGRSELNTATYLAF
jgi:hypothetical protein